MSLHTCRCQGPHKPSSCTTFTLSRVLLQAKKFLQLCMQVTLVVSRSLRPCGLWPARLLCQGVSPGKNTGAYWPILVAITF